MRKRIEHLAIWTLLGLALGLAVPAFVLDRGLSSAWLWGVAGALLGLSIGIALRKPDPEP